MAIEILEHCSVAPSPGAATDQMLPLLHFDIVWLRSHLLENLIFYTFQCSKSHFSDTIVPNLKNSLSLTLKHFLPLAGKIIFPLTSGMPFSHYIAGHNDSMSLTIAVSDGDFVPLMNHHSRNADDFRDFVPHFPSATYSPDFIKFPVAAVQVTLFPNQGLCIGFTNHHAIGDGSALLCFLQSWASVNKLNGDAHLVALGEKALPFYDRSVVKDANKLATIGWSLFKMCSPTVSSTISLPTHKVRGTFVLSEAEIRKLKSYVMKKRPDTVHLSSFVVVCAYVWSCLAKSAADAGEEVVYDEPEYLCCTADCRARLSPPLPETYFGNCLALVVAESNHGRLKGDDGLVDAAQAIGEAIYKINNDRGILDGFERRLKELTNLVGKRVVKVAGSPRFDVYGADFGWGRPRKFEDVHIDYDGAVSLCKSRGEGVEIGFSMAKVKMDAFAAVFNQGLGDATRNV